MDIRDGFSAAVGNTPLIKLQRVSEETGCTILGKAEFLNPGSSVKDRAALAIIENAEQAGLLCPGGFVVEGTAGNTGIGLALVGNTEVTARHHHPRKHKPRKKGYVAAMAQNLSKYLRFPTRPTITFMSRSERQKNLPNPGLQGLSGLTSSINIKPRRTQTYYGR